MNSRSFSRLLRASAVAAALLVAPSYATSQGVPEANQPDVENGKFQFEGVLTRAEFVRSLPGDNFYPTTKLDAGAKVIVVGSKNNWLKILPPPGSFSYVQKAFVQAHGDGKQGKATSQLIVRAGSSLQPVMWVTQAKLEKGETVEIVGEEEQYFKIKPPAGAYLYVATDAVKPGQQVVVSPTGQVTPVAAAAAPAPERPAAPVQPAPAPTASAEATSPAAPAPAPAAPTNPDEIATEIPRPPLGDIDREPAMSPETRPTLTGDPAPTLVEPTADAAEPTSRPANPLALAPKLTAVEAVDNLKSLEQQFTAASQQPLTDQPLSDLIDGYERVAEADGIGDMTRRVAEMRLATLKLRADAREQLLSVQASRKNSTEALVAQKAESKELRDRIAESATQSYTAVGTIRKSSLQVSRTPIFRLTDPQTGRTLAYVWGTDPKVITSEGQFVAIRGDVKTDSRFNFKVITPTFVESVDPQKLYTAYDATITPPSLLPRTTATTATPGE